MRIAIVGLGYVGSTLAKQLLAAGHQIFGIKRSQIHLPGIIGIQADVTIRSSLSRIPDDLDHVVYAISPGAREDEAYRRAYPLGISHMLDALPNSRFTFVSSTAVYPQKNGEEVTEKSATQATNFSSERLLEAENLLLTDTREHTIVRSSGIYGPERTRLISQLVHSELDEKTRAISTSRIHRDDLASCLHFLLDREKPGGLYIASDPHPATLGEMQDWIRNRQSLETSRTMQLSASFSADSRSSRRILPLRLLNEGFHFKYPSFREGYSAILRQAQENESQLTRSD